MIEYRRAGLTHEQTLAWSRAVCCYLCRQTFFSEEVWWMHRVEILINGKEHTGCLLPESLVDLGWTKDLFDTWEPPYVE